MASTRETELSSAHACHVVASLFELNFSLTGFIGTDLVVDSTSELFERVDVGLTCVVVDVAEKTVGASCTDVDGLARGGTRGADDRRASLGCFAAHELATDLLSSHDGVIAIETL